MTKEGLQVSRPTPTQAHRMQTATSRQDVRKPFSLFSTVVSHGWYETLPFRWEQSEQALLRAEALRDGRVMLIRVEEVRSPKRGHVGLAITVRGTGARDPGVALEMSRRVAVMLHTGEDLREFYALCATVPELQEARRLGAGRCMRAPTLWEDVLKTVLGTNVTWRQAVTMINRLALLGDPCPALPELRSWPSPGQIVRAKEKYLRDTVRAGYRSPYIMELAHAQKSGAIDLEAIDAMAQKLSEQELYKKLVSLKGVGKSSAHFLMNLLGHYDHLPVDSATYAYATRELFNGRRPTEKQIRRRYAHYGKWQSLAYWYERWEPRLRWWEPATPQA